ncbi:hypothetical protein DY926_15285 [Komagataeibacter melaceti]|uniref:Uncharacterized protein n=1 Tax=Komagataeibacter melaceti TaxID=2766577 RepID=A0A371YWR0_9PROT|nr:hypothetical protein DY926_15285 [Komagataeibacter melaceti]
MGRAFRVTCVPAGKNIVQCLIHRPRAVVVVARPRQPAHQRAHGRCWCVRVWNC